MSSTIGSDVTYITAVPSFSDPADIQTAFKLYHYGSESVPATYADIVIGSSPTNVSSGIAGYLKFLNEKKANLASPTFTGTVTLPNNTVTNAMILNESITINGATVELGGSTVTKSILYGTTSGGTTTYPTAPSNNIYVGANAPASPSVGDIWMW